MANYSILKAAIAQVIKYNGNNEITGNLLQQQLFSMVNTLGTGYQCMGVAVLTPIPTNPGTPDANVFYIASEPGTYVNFDNIVINNGEVCLLTYNGTWSKRVTGAATAASVADVVNSVSTIQELIPSTAAPSNKLATEDEIHQLGQEINGGQEYQPLSVELTTGYYYNQANNKVSTTLVEREDTSCARIDVTAGDKYKIYGRGTGVIHLYAFTDSNQNVLLTNTEIVNTRENGLELTAPEGSAYLYINYYSYDSSTDKLQKWVVSDGLVQRVGELEDDVDDLDEQLQQKVAKSDIVDNLNTDDATKPLSAKQGKVLKTAIQAIDVEINGERSYVPVTLTLTSDSYRGINATLNTVNNTLSSRTGTSCADLDVVAGDKFKIFGKGTGAICLYVFADSDRNILSRNTEAVNSRENGLEVTAPTGATKLYINFLDYDSTIDKLQKAVILGGLVQRVGELGEQLEQGLNQKINKSDIVNDLNTGGATKVLSAEQGKLLKSAVVIIGKEIDGDSHYEPIELTLTTDNYRGINSSLNTVNANLTERTGTKCAELDAAPGDKFKLFGKGSGAICLYIFADSDRNILDRNTTLINTRENGLEVTAPASTTKLYINFLDYDSTTDKAEKYFVEEGILQRVSDLEESSADLKQRVEDLEEASGSVLKNKVFIAFGDSITEFKWTGAGGDNKGWVDHTEELTGCTIINCAIGGSHMNANANYNVELFDSLHEYAVGDYVFYKPSDTMNLYRCIAPHTGVWNASNFEDVSSNQSLIGTVAYAPIFVYPMIHAFCNTAVVDKNERFKNQIAAAECIYTWKTSQDDNRAIIERLKNADASQIDGVIIAEGTNDYVSAWNRGTSGSFDVGTCLGATNQAILELCTTYKHLALYYVTPPVRWWNWSNGAGNIEDFSDNYKDNGESDITLREWVEILKNEYRLRHIPSCDLYNELAWNQWNFANYFPANDGTHPRPGFKNIGAKVASFLIAHNVIK